MFPKPSFEDWKNQAIAELKGKNFDKSLIWQSPDEIPVQPIYIDVPEELAEPVSTGQSGWEIIEPVDVTDAISANKTAISALEGGATSIFFNILSTDIHPDTLLKDILLDIAPVYLKGLPQLPEWSEFLNNNSDTLVTPLTDLLDEVNKGNFSSSKIESTPSSDIHLLVDSSIFKESGGSIIHEIGYAIASLQEQLHLLTHTGQDTKRIQEIVVQTAVGNHYFFEIAKIRAIRKLAVKVVEAYRKIPLKIISRSANIHISHTDIHTNLLRLTTVAMSAVLGKSDGVMLMPFEKTEHTRRITRNIHHLLREESHFHQFADPAAGSYYISHLTKTFMDAAWQLFLDVEKQGGYISGMQNGIIQQNISSHREKLQKDIAIRKSTLLGVNQFPNLDAPPLSAYHQESQQSEKGLYPIRLAEPFERLRLATERYIAAGHQRPLAYLLKFGNPAISNARATWSLNFLACAGIASVEGNTDLDTAVKELFSTGAQIIVLCGENDSWLLTLPDILSKIPEKSIKILSGKGDIGHVDFCIYEGCDARSALSNLLEKLGISI